MITCECAFNFNAFSFTEGNIILYFLQVYENVGRHNESSNIWTIPYYFLDDVFRRYLRYNGNYFSLINNTFFDVYSYVLQICIKQTCFSPQNFRNLTRNFRHTFETRTARINSQVEPEEHTFGFPKDILQRII
jgi:hypothetical protein